MSRIPKEPFASISVRPNDAECRIGSPVVADQVTVRLIGEQHWRLLLGVDAAGAERIRQGQSHTGWIEAMPGQWIQVTSIAEMIVKEVDEGSVAAAAEQQLPSHWSEANPG